MADALIPERRPAQALPRLRQLFSLKRRQSTCSSSFASSLLTRPATRRRPAIYRTPSFSLPRSRPLLRPRPMPVRALGRSRTWRLSRKTIRTVYSQPTTQTRRTGRPIPTFSALCPPRGGEHLLAHPRAGGTRAREGQAIHLCRSLQQHPSFFLLSVCRRAALWARWRNLTCPPMPPSTWPTCPKRQSSSYDRCRSYPAALALASTLGRRHRWRALVSASGRPSGTAAAPAHDESYLA